MFGLGEPWPSVIRVAVALLVAAVVLRWSHVLVRWGLVARSDRRFPDAGADTAQLTGLKRRETTISLLGTTLRYVVFVIAAAVVFQAVTGSGKATAVAGASLLVLIALRRPAIPDRSSDRRVDAVRGLVRGGRPDHRRAVEA